MPLNCYLDYVYIGENVLHDENVDLGQFYEFAQFFQNDNILVLQILDIFNCRCNSKDLYPRPELQEDYFSFTNLHRQLIFETR